MARVIYTGPLNPVIFARAKKEAEKAERIKGYTPRVIKTPAHTVVYSKTGQEVKAVVMDMLAPITFSIPGSAIPVRPSFLHLHPDLPEKVYGRSNYAKATGVTQNWGFGEYGSIDNTMLQMFANLPIESEFYFSALKNPTPGMGYRYRPYDYSFFEVGLTRDIGSLSMFDVASAYATTEDLSLGIVGTWRKFIEPNLFGAVPPLEVGGAGGFIFSMERGGCIVLSNMDGEYSYYLSRAPTSVETIYEVTYKNTIDMNYTSVSTIDAIEGDIRDHQYGDDDGIRFISTNGISHIIKSDFDSYSNVGVTSTQILKSRDISGDVLSDQHMIGPNGEKIHSFINILTKSESKYDYKYNYGPQIAAFTDSISVACSVGVIKNLSLKTYNIQTINIEQEHEYYKNADNEQFLLKDVRVFLHIPASFPGFDGVLIYAIAFEEWTGHEVDWGGFTKSKKKKYDESNAFASSHLSYYFDFYNGEYMLDDNVHTKPPRLTTDGICLPHAWFFVRGNETRETDFYPNNHNRLSIVIYPQGRHEFSVDEAEIVSVELNHTPRFVVKPGGSIYFNMQAIFDGDPLVPYVVNGLVEELDEDGKPTGFYLAADGAVEGVFKAYQQSEVYRLSPRQRLDAYRLITVETTTERKYGVQAAFEVFGSGVRVQPGPPSITLECINTSVLAGQTTVFYVTATHIALGSKLRYEIKRAGAVVSAGYLTIVGGGAGYVEYVAPFTVQSNGGSPQRYVLANPLTGTAAPSVQEFEFSIIHDQAPAPETFSVRYSQESYASASDRPAALPMPPMFFMGAAVSVDGSDQAYGSNAQQTLINRLYYSLKSKKVYALFWDGQSCEVSSLLRQNPDTGQYEYNPDWKEVPFDYPPAVDPYGTPGALEPYVYAYLEYEKNRTGA